MEDFGLGYKPEETVYVAAIPQHIVNGDEILFNTIKDGLTSYRLFYDNTVPACLKPNYEGAMSADDVALAEENMRNGIIKLSINDNSFIKIFSKKEFLAFQKRAAEQVANGEVASIKLHEIGLDNEAAMTKQIEEKEVENEALKAKIAELQEMLAAQSQQGKKSNKPE